ncbi:MAG: thioredoxin domain-containing protein, partial [bacterium]|nr:thioredoxin domain-containing protein [bacterium]
MKKINTQTIIITTLVLIIVGFAYNQWGKGIFPSIKYKLSRESEKDKLQIGDANAKIRIVEYYSYTCEYCRNFESEVKPKIIKNYVSSGKVKWIFRPIDQDLGDAILCAEEQGKFLEYHDSLFRNASNISKAEDLKVLAKNVDMNEEVFWECYSSGKYRTLVTGWYSDLMSDFRKYKISEDKKGTP